MKTPGPDHPITVTPATTRWRALFQGHVIADSADALVLQEADYPPVIYFPREDVSMEYMARTDHRTHCPYKGDAAYYTLRMDSEIADNAVWTYEEPYPAMTMIAGRVAFYPNVVEVYAVDDAAVNPHHDDEAAADRAAIDEAIQHTDAGDGTTQREHWPPNVSTPGVEGGLR
jgi:uncharacterized protein (DUF427 family)